MISSRLSSALALAVKAHDGQVRKGKPWYQRALADVLTQRRAPMVVMLEAEVQQMERLAGAQRVAA